MTPAAGVSSAKETLPWRMAALALFANLLWGGNLVAVKMGLRAVPPIWSAFARFSLGVGVLIPWTLWRRVPLSPRPGEWSGLVVLGTLFTIQIGFMNWGTHLTTAGLASTLMATNPLFASLFAHAFVPGDRLTQRRAAGLAAAFLGVCLILLGRGSPGSSADPTTAGLLGNLLMLCSAAMLGARLVFAQRLLQRIDTERVVVWQMLIALPAFALAAWLTESFDPAGLAWPPLAAIAYQGIVIAGLGFMISASLLSRYLPSTVTGFNFTAPVFGVILSVFLLGEIVTWPLLAGLAAVALGILVFTTGGRTERSPQNEN